MKISIDPVISSRIKSAWGKLPTGQQSQIAAHILSANQQAVLVSQTGNAPLAKAASNSLVLAHSALTDDSDGVVSNLKPGVVLDVGPDGTIWGTGKWQQLDPGWTEAFAVYLETLLPLGGKQPFLANPQVIQIPDRVTIGIVGDWGTGDWGTAANPAPSTDVRNHLALLKPDITIHLGDVYYAGTTDQELHSLIKIWPSGTRASFTLNSNHEMYSGAKPYFAAIVQPPFDQQKGCSYFALENSKWIVVGLDSAYFSPENDLYLNGLIFPIGASNEQASFLQAQSAKAQAAGKQLIVFTHHNGLDLSGTTSNDLFTQVLGACAGGATPSYWYWGHNHAGAIYKPFGDSGILCRCCGHGALPWGQSSELSGSAGVAWYETRSANDADLPQRLLNGFAVLKLDGANMQEFFYDENGGIACQGT